jgi:hypothetical protein
MLADPKSKRAGGQLPAMGQRHLIPPACLISFLIGWATDRDFREDLIRGQHSIVSRSTVRTQVDVHYQRLLLDRLIELPVAGTVQQVRSRMIMYILACAFGMQASQRRECPQRKASYICLRRYSATAAVVAFWKPLPTSPRHSMRHFGGKIICGAREGRS